MWCAHGASRNNRPLCVIPDSGQVSENSSHSPLKQSCDVFHDDVSRSSVANKARVFHPQSAAASIQPFAGPCCADVLTREAAADNVNPVNVGCGELADILEDGNVGPVLSQDCSAVGIDFAERDGAHSCSLKPETESANSRKDVEDIHFT
jgi:hypothetical protein